MFHDRKMKTFTLDVLLCTRGGRMKLDGVILTLRILLGKEKQGRKFIYILERKNSQKLQMRWENVCVGKRLFFNV